MNIFVLHTNPVIAAQMQCDKHVVKMVLETAQMLSTITNGPYKPTHVNHPCTLWAGKCVGNLYWLIDHGLALCSEYTKRYDKRHKCQDIIEDTHFTIEDNLHLLFPERMHDDLSLTPFAQCMPEQFRQENPVLAYRAYYHSKPFAAWDKGRPAPSWWSPELQSCK